VDVAPCAHTSCAPEMQQAVDSRQTLASQLSENVAVRKEFAALAPDAHVYKQMGPGLMKQDQAEARSNVEKRIEFIEAEIKRAETRLRELADKGEKQKNELVELQTTLQAREQEA
ncbi:Prefoldin, partial [Tilletiopsis washingtonensis]